MSIGAGLERAAEWISHGFERLRELARERPGLALGLGLGGVSLLVGLVLLLALPGIVEARVRERTEALGLSFAARDTDVGLGGVSFQGVTVTLAGRKEPLMAAEALELDLAYTRLGDGARAALERVELAGAKVDLDVASLVALRDERRAKSSAGGEGGPSAGLPALEVRGMSLRVRDGQGVLASADGIDAHAEGTSWSATLAQAELGAAPSDVIRIERARAEGPLEGRPALAKASALGATLTWSADTDASTPTSLARLFAARDALRSGGSDAGDDGATAKRALWTDDATVSLSGMRVLGRDADGTTRAMLEDLTATVSAQGPGAFGLRGAGKAPGAGEVAWDLRAVPREARVEGNVRLHDVSLALFAPVLPRLPFFELEKTRVDADLELAGKGLASIDAQGELTLTDLTFAADGLSRVPVGPFTLSARGQGTWTPSLRELAITKGDVRVGAAAVSLAGTLAWPSDGYRVDLDAQLARTGCQEVLASIPAGLLDELATITLSGTIGGKLTMHVAANDLDATKVDFDVDDACKFTSVPPLLDLMRFEQPFIHTVLEPDGTIFELETGPGTPAWTPIELVSPFMIQSVVAHEDGRFFTHHGFAEPEIAVALSRNLKAGAFKFGASTITMQLVKNVFLHRDKLLARKVQEALITWWLEQQWDKRRILQLYVNVIEYGPSIYGLRNAAWHYFGTIPMNLTPAQSAFLAAVLPAPKVFHEHYDKGQLSASMKNRMATFMKHLHARQRIDDEALAYGLEELEHFTFYDPEKPPPPPPVVRGTAQAPPFDAAAIPYDQWELDQVLEDGSYGP